jgi:hypothetical protein
VQEIYDDTEDFDEISSQSTTAMSQSKFIGNKTSPLVVQPEEIPKNDYDDESDTYQNDENIEEETSHPDDANVIGDGTQNARPDTKPSNIDLNQKKTVHVSSTTRLPFVPSNLWRELFTKPGILVGKFSSREFDEFDLHVSFRYNRRCCHWHVICYTSGHVHYLSYAQERRRLLCIRRRTKKIAVSCLYTSIISGIFCLDLTLSDRS